MPLFFFGPGHSGRFLKTARDLDLWLAFISFGAADFLRRVSSFQVRNSR